jgi:hypothetical protein
MFRLSNKGNQSRNNHKIINQTTKICDSDGGLSKTAIQAQLQQEQELVDKLKLEMNSSESLGKLRGKFHRYSVVITGGGPISPKVFFF